MSCEEIYIKQDPGLPGVVQSWSGGSTGLTPSTPTTGDVVLDGVLNVAHGGTGATTAEGALTNLGVPVFSVLNYGAVADGDGQGGGTSFTAALSAALTAANSAGGGIVLLPATGTNIYRMGTLLSGTWSNITILLDDGVQIDTTNIVSGGYAIRNTGSIGTAVLLTAQAVRGDDTLTVASTTGLAIGDWIRVKSTIDCLSSDTRAGVWEAADVLRWQLGEPTSGGANVRFGEFVQIKSVDSATQITLSTELIFPKYPIVPVPLAGTMLCSTIQKLTPVENFWIKGGEGFTRYQSGQVPGGITYKGGWNATTNSPALTSSVGTEGDYYYVAVAGTTNLNGVSSWSVGKTALFTGGVWVKTQEAGANIVRFVYSKDCGVDTRFNLSYMTGSAVVVDDSINFYGSVVTRRPANLDVDLYDHSGYNGVEVTASLRAHIFQDSENDSQTFDETYHGDGVPCVDTWYEGRALNCKHVAGTSHGASYGLRVGPLQNTGSRAAFFNRARFFSITDVTSTLSPTNSIGIIELGPWAIDGSITDCHIDGAIYGIEVSRSGFSDGPAAKNLLIANNVFLRCQYAINVKTALDTPATAELSNLLIQGNTFKECGDYGIFLSEYTNGAVISGNNFGAMTGSAPVAIRGESDCVGTRLYNNTATDIGSASTFISIASITDTVTFPNPPYYTSQIRVRDNTLLGTGIFAGGGAAGTFLHFEGAASYTFLPQDVNTTLFSTRNSAQTLTLDTTLGAAASFPGDTITVIQEGTGPVTFVASGVTINARNGLVMPGQWSTATLTRRGATSWDLTMGPNVTVTSPYRLAATLTADSTVTFPTTGTLATLAGSETLTNKTLTAPVISTISNSGTLTLPTGANTLATLAGSETLSNKTLTTPVIGAATGTSLAVTAGLTALSGTAIGAGANTQAFVKASSTANLGIYYGTGDPGFSAAKGSLYSKTDATTTTTRLWVNTDGGTTWAFFTASA